MPRTLRLVAGLLLLLVLAGYLGHLHPIGDTFAVFRLYAAGALALVGLVQLRARVRNQGLINLAIGIGVIVAAGVLPFGRQITPPAGAATISHYQKNVLYGNDDPRAVLDDILARAPDVVTLQEAAGPSALILEELYERYPSGVACDTPDAYGQAVFSAYPPIPDTAFCGTRIAGLQVEGPDGPLWVISIHLRWVYPYHNAIFAARLAPELAALDGPKIVAGDFNVVPWAASVDRVSEAGGVQRVGRALVTFALAGVLRVQIDNILATGGEGVTRRLPKLGSDHWGVWADYTINDS
ncbi:MAG: endonuclease/exonuclease/phosphatase family protein [Pseudomonadota bacterium]|nr:endonuclease/exonuclease/phosphatase family protein [Pseudomonadota bacterium]